MNRPVPLSRRALLSSALSLGALAVLPPARAHIKAKLVVIGGGFGGASAAQHLRTLLPDAEITLVEPNPIYTACPFSNLVISGTRTLSQQQFGYESLRARGITLAHDRAVAVDTSKRHVRLQSGHTLAYDRLILSPGIDIRWNQISGYDQAAAEHMPHAWKAGGQTELLRAQLTAMPEGGLVVMSVPPAPYRCPPGPYERASLIAHYLKTHKPRSKLLILDAKDSFSKQSLFQAAWAEHYPHHIEWRSATEDGRVARIDAATRTVWTDFESYQADVVNIIPPQKAGQIADLAGVSDATGWCPIDPVSFESTRVPGIHVIGDATLAAPMPKSAFSANLQAKICAHAIASLLSERAPEPTILTNTCYSYTTPETAVSITGVYTSQDHQLRSVAGAGGVSPLAAEVGVRRTEAAEAAAWFQTITQDAFG